MSHLFCSLCAGPSCSVVGCREPYTGCTPVLHPSSDPGRGEEGPAPRSSPPQTASAPAPRSSPPPQAAAPAPMLSRQCDAPCQSPGQMCCVPATPGPVASGGKSQESGLQGIRGQRKAMLAADLVNIKSLNAQIRLAFMLTCSTTNNFCAALCPHCG